MGRSPRTVFPDTVTLVEAFRPILRAMYPGQPTLADKIPTRFGWQFSYPDDDKTLPKDRRIKIRAKEVTALKKMFKIKEARELFGRLVAQEKLRLRGVLDPSKPLDDIDPADARVGLVDILAGELRVFLNGKLVRTYRQVHCYETDVDRCVAELRSETKYAKRTSEADFEEFKQNFLTSEAPQTEAAITQAATSLGINRPREDLRKALPPNRPRGPRPKSPGK
jgi:hypothetical protein